MKTKLLFTMLFSGLLFSAALAQNYELWGISSCTNAGGALYKTDGNGNNLEIVYTLAQDLSEGTEPYGGLLQADNGKLYAMTQQGGVDNLGALIAYDISENAVTVLANFDGFNGMRPEGELIQASNGKLYGMTRYGGSVYGTILPGTYYSTSGFGVIFEYDPVNSTYSVVWEFSGPDGSEPFGSLVEADDGFLYGMNRQGSFSASAYYGVLFKYDMANQTLSVLHKFSPSTGANPEGTLLRANNGKFYGTTSRGGANGYGGLFEYDPLNGNYTNLYSFIYTSPNGNLPGKGLIQASDGKLYGVTSYGGTNNKGTLFQYDIETKTMVKKVDFVSEVEGAWSDCTLLQASNGKIYGTSPYGGASSGAMFEYDPVEETAVNKFNYQTIGYPMSGLIEIQGTQVGIPDMESELVEASLFPNPTSEFVNISIKNLELEPAFALYDLSGKLLEEKKISTNETCMNLTAYPVGTYILKLYTADQKVLKDFRIIKN